jgi:pilus assembly protein CpaC
MPGFSDIPILGKLFTSKSTSTSHSELVVIVTPELVAPISDPNGVPNLKMPLKFIEGKEVMDDAPRTAGADKTGPAPTKPKRDEIPVQEMEKFERDQMSIGNGGGGSSTPASPMGGSGMGSGGGGSVGGNTVTMSPVAAAAQTAASTSTSTNNGNVAQPSGTAGK